MGKEFLGASIPGVTDNIPRSKWKPVMCGSTLGPAVFGIFPSDIRLGAQCGDTVSGASTVKGADKGGAERLLIRACHDRRRKEGFTLREGKFSLDSEGGGVKLRGINLGCAQKGDLNRPWH